MKHDIIKDKNVLWVLFILGWTWVFCNIYFNFKLDDGSYLQDSGSMLVLFTALEK